MPTAQEIQCAEVLYAALAEPIGLVLRTSNPTKARAALYRARQSIGDTELAVLTIRPAPDAADTSLWIFKNAPAEGESLAP